MPSPIEFVYVIQFSALAIRWIHFVTLAVLLGGALAVALLDRPSLTLARRYEYLFWVALGFAVVSGVGNVGLLAPNVPDIDSRWGSVFAVKLIAVFGFIVFSIIRSGIVVRISPEGIVDRRWYVLTALWVAVLVALAVVMVRG